MHRRQMQRTVYSGSWLAGAWFNGLCAVKTRFASAATGGCGEALHNQLCVLGWFPVVGNQMEKRAYIAGDGSRRNAACTTR